MDWLSIEHNFQIILFVPFWKCHIQNIHHVDPIPTWSAWAPPCSICRKDLNFLNVVVITQPGKIFNPTLGQGNILIPLNSRSLQITCQSSRTSCWTACRRGWTGSSRGRPTGTTSTTGQSSPSRPPTSCAVSRPKHGYVIGLVWSYAKALLVRLIIPTDWCQPQLEWL